MLSLTSVLGFVAPVMTLVRQNMLTTIVIVLGLIGYGYSHYNGYKSATEKFENQQAKVKMKIIERNSELEKSDILQAEKEKQIVIKSYDTLQERLKAIDLIPNDGCLDKFLFDGLRTETSGR